MSISQERIIVISKSEGLTHIGSNLTAVPLIEAVYAIKKPGDGFVLSAGHAALAQYVVMEKYGLCNALEAVRTYGIHPDSSMPGIRVSTGSLGHGFPVTIK